MNRFCFQLRVDPDHVAEYRQRHAAVWPDMLRALQDAGWQNYSLFLADDGLLIGYVEASVPLEELQTAMAGTEVNSRWQADMAQFFVGLNGAPDTGFAQLTEVFHLEEQLALLDSRGGNPKPTFTPEKGLLT